MAKRFTATEIWDNPAFIELSPSAKLLWYYLKDKCDNAGVIKLSGKLAKFHLEINGDFSATLKELEIVGWIRQLSAGKYLLPDFISFQYGALSEGCKPHRQVLDLLRKHGLEYSGIKGYGYPMDTVQDKDKEKDKDNIGGCGGKFTLKDVQDASCLVGITPAQAESFFHHYNGQGWVFGNGIPVRDLSSALVKWRNNGYKFPEPPKPKRELTEEEIIAQHDEKCRRAGIGL